MAPPAARNFLGILCASSLGQSHAESDGYRDNNDLTLDTYNAFAQMQLSPAFSFRTTVPLAVVIRIVEPLRI